MSLKTFCSSVLLFYTTNKIGFFIMIGSVIGLVLGEGLRYVDLTSRERMYVGFLAELFLQIVKGIAIPLYCANVIIAISSVGKELSARIRCHLLTIIILTDIETTLLGIALALAIRPGKGYKYLDTLEAKYHPEIKRNHTTEVDELLDMIRNLFPENWIITSMKRARTFIIKTNDSREEFFVGLYTPLNLLGITMICFFIGISVRMIKINPKPFLDLMTCIAVVTLSIMRWVLYATPLFMISLVAYEILDTGAVILLSQIALYIVTFLLGFTIHVLIFNPLIYVIVMKKNPYRFLTQIWEAIWISIRTSSSEAAFASSVTILKEKIDCDPQLVDYALPIAFLLSKDGSCFLFAVMFILIAQDCGYPMEPHYYIYIFIISMAGSIGVPGISHGCLLIGTSLLQSAELHLYSICIVFTMDWLLDRFQTAMNVAGNIHGIAILNRINKKFLESRTESEQKEE